MTYLLRLALAMALIGFEIPDSAAAEPAFRFPRSSPEAQGIASAKILAFIEAADAKIDALHKHTDALHAVGDGARW